MDIPPPESPARVPAPPTAAVPATPLPPPAAQMATVIAVSEVPPAPGATLASYLLELELEGALVPAQSERRIEPGSQLLLRQYPGGTVRVESVRPPPPADAALREALRAALPRQLPLADLVPALQRALVDPALPQALRPALESLIARLPSPAAVQHPAGLRSAMENSGTRLESRLARALGWGPPATAGVPRAPAAPAPPAAGAVPSSPAQGAALVSVAPATASLRPAPGSAGSPQPSGAGAAATGAREAAAPAVGAMPPNAAAGTPAVPASAEMPTAGAAGPGKAMPGPATAPLRPAPAPPGNTPRDVGTGSAPHATAPVLAQEPGPQVWRPLTDGTAATSARTVINGDAPVPPPPPAQPSGDLSRPASVPLAPSGSTYDARGRLVGAAPQAPVPERPTPSPGPSLGGREELPVAAALRAPLPPPAEAPGRADLPPAPSGSTGTTSAQALQAMPLARTVALPAAGPPVTSSAGPVAATTPPAAGPSATASAAATVAGPAVPASRTDSVPTLPPAAPSPVPPPTGTAVGRATGTRPAIPSSGTYADASPRTTAPATPAPPAPPTEIPQGPVPAPAVPGTARPAAAAVLPPTTGAPPATADVPLRDADLASRQAAVPPATRAAEFAPPPAGKRIAEPGDGRRPTDTVAPRAGTLVDAVRTHDLKAGLATLLLGLRSWLESTSHAAAGAPRAAGTAQPDDALPPLYTARGLAESQPPVLPMAEPGVRPSRHPDPRPPGARADADAVEQLVRYVEGALARTRVHQFGAVHETRGGTDSTGVPTWIVELPLAHGRDADLLQLRIENHGTPGSPAAEAARVWQVLMCIDCAATGPLHALVRLAGLRLSATLWAERAGTLRAARAALGELDEALRAQGVEVERLECMPGKPAAAVGARFERLLDVRT